MKKDPVCHSAAPEQAPDDLRAAADALIASVAAEALPETLRDLAVALDAAVSAQRATQAPRAGQTGRRLH